MELSTVLGLLAVVVLILLNGFFVATEFAIVAVRRSRIDQLAQDGNATARAAREVVGQLDAYIAASQLGITMASLALGWVGEPAFAHLIEPPMELLVGQFAPAAAHGVAVGITFALITGLHIVLGEQVPKLIGLQRPEGTVLLVARPIRLFYVLFRWPIAALNRISNSVLKLFGLEPGTGHEMVHSVEEMHLLVTGMQQAGVVEASEARIARRAFEFADLTAGELMTPRTELEAVPVTVTRDELLARAAVVRHSRLLVYGESLDDAVGVLHVHDLFKVLDQPADQFDTRTILRPILPVPESKPADDLLEEMRAARQQLAVVIDEYGGTAGVVTLEDLVEALVGQIQEEPGIGGEQGSVDIVVQQPDGSLILDGLTRLDEFEELTGIRLGAEAHEAVDTLGGLVMATLGRIPELGEEIRVERRVLRVEALDGRRVAAVRMLPPEPREAGVPPDGTSPAPPAGSRDAA